MGLNIKVPFVMVVMILRFSVLILVVPLLSPQLYLRNCTYKIVDKQMIHYLDHNSFTTNED